MRSLTTAAAAAAALLLAVPVAHASGTGENGPVGIGVIGKGLRVKEVRATLDGWKPGAKARISLWRGGVHQRWVTGWKSTSSGQMKAYKYELATWKINKKFPHNTKLCAEFVHDPDRRACAKILR